MKQLSSTFYLFFLMVCFLSFFSSCEVDKEFLDAKDSGKQMKRQISFQKFKQEIGKVSFGNQLSISAAGTGRTLEEFEIDTTLVKALETDKVVYTMKLEPKFEVADGKFYNLVVYKDNFDEIIKNIIEIHPQSELLGNTEPEIGTYLENSLKEIIYSSRLAPVEAPLCVAVDYQYLCYCGNHREGFCEGYCAAGFRWVPVLISVYCTSGGGESIPDEGYGGSSGDNGENFMLDPVLPSFDDVTPCQQISLLMQPYNANMKPKIQVLGEYTSNNSSSEFGFEFSKNSSGEFYNSPVVSSLTTGNIVKTRVGGDFYAAGHNHTPEIISIFSWSDIFMFFTLYDKAASYNKDDVTYFLVAKNCFTCAENNVYALKVDNFTQLRNKINSTLNNSNTMGMSFSQKIQYAESYYMEKFKSDMNQSQLESVFLEYFNNFGFSIYKANPELTNWSKLSLSGNPISPVVSNPCN